MAVYENPATVTIEGREVKLADDVANVSHTSGRGYEVEYRTRTFATVDEMIEAGVLIEVQA